MNQNEKESPKIQGEEEYERAIYLINSGHFKESMALFHKSANLNYPPSFLWLYSLLVDVSERQNWKIKAEPNFTWYQSKAQDGKPDSLHNLGICFQKGIGTNIDWKKAAELYTKAAEQGFADSQCNLGVFYQYGNGVPKDMNKAIELYNKAAQQGHGDAQYCLGVCYKHGDGVPKDIKRAIELYSKSAEQGNEDAQLLDFSCVDVDVQVLVDSLKVDRAIDSLFINECKIEDKGAQAIADLLKINNTLIDLTLSDCGIGDIGALAIANALKINKFKVKEIELTNTNISNIERALGIKKVLLKLNLARNDIGNEGISAIAEMLKVNNSLRKLDIAGNDFEDISKLEEALKCNRSLTELTIEEDKLIIEELERALEHNICLLDIRKNSLYTFQSSIIELLQRNKKIQTTLSKRIFECKNTHLLLLDYKILERVNVAVIFKNVWELHQTQQTEKTYEKYLREYWELISIGFSKNFLFILGVCKLNQIAPSRSHLLGIPKEILDYIGSFLNPKDFSIDFKENHKILKKENQELKKQFIQLQTENQELKKHSIQLAQPQSENQELKKQLANKRKKTENDQNRRKRRK